MHSSHIMVESASPYADEASVDDLQQDTPTEPLLPHSQHASDEAVAVNSADEGAESVSACSTVGKSAEGCTEQASDSGAMQIAHIFSNARYAKVEGRLNTETLGSMEDGRESDNSQAAKATMLGVYLTKR
jgi:myo-inositol-hexaphosphate 3-phosphohydrolase